MVMVMLYAILNGLTYRTGGSGNAPRWVRQVGVGLFTYLTLMSLNGFKLDAMIIATSLISAGLAVVASTTYFKKKGTDAGVVNWALVGLAFGLSCFPYAYVTHHYLGFAIRTLFLSVFMPIWCLSISNKLSYYFRKVWDDAVIEEFGRGVIIILTYNLFLFL